MATKLTVQQEVRDRHVAALPRLTIDARLSRTGIGTYTLNLLSAVRQLDAGFRTTAILRPESVSRFSDLTDEIRLVDVSIYSVREQFSILFATRDCDLLHVPHFNIPICHRGPIITTIHDLTHMTEPAFRYSARAWLYARPMLHLAAKKATHIITVSEFSKNEITRRLNVPPENVTAIYHGIDSDFHPNNRNEAAEAVRLSLGIRQPYLLYVGNLKPHKNLHRLIEAFAQIRRREPALLLILVGDDRKHRTTVLETCRVLGVLDAVRQISWVPQHLLHQIYRAAELLVMPSTNEGFGFPVLEAMASGTPVVSSNAAALPEIGGDAAIYFDPLSVEALTDVIERVLASPGLQNELKEKGLKQAVKFTWQECARKHVNVYRRVLGR